MLLQVFKFPHAIALPTYATQYSSGLDLYASVNDNVILLPMQRCIIPTGVGIILPITEDDDMYEAQIRPRSGIAIKHGVTVLNSPGTIDSDYHDEIKVILINLGEEPFIIKSGMRIAQMVVCKNIKIEMKEIFEINSQNRKGFGSTGI
ncbi:dUTP diphosphatase [Candidatus Gromoviella agglomerans]|uniref:dUTP diphosphatase n=1 Tax=Candidatus Gromoviella agglomerans TaxID=2806609 RepID=UPI001E42E53F|nr:dUTP diphosphatase [Candidatus Gromoviella agglomerans]UFX98179.1 dUTP diphosphatase [Candidatus Gromoviella agglomerans]